MSHYIMSPYIEGLPTFRLELEEGAETYEFYEIAPDGAETLLFEGSDFRIGASMPSYDCEESARCLMGFLSLRIGDTDREYFDKYTERQTDFMEAHAETLSLYTEDGQPFDDIIEC